MQEDTSHVTYLTCGPADVNRLWKLSHLHTL